MADKALDQGRGGISRLSELTGLSRTTITKAVAELSSRKKLAVAERGQIREAGGGRKKVEDADPGLQVELGKILEETSAGDPMSALRWTNKSTRSDGGRVDATRHPVSDKTVARCLRKMGYSMQLTRRPGKARNTATGITVPLHQPAGEPHSGRAEIRYCRWTRRRRNWWDPLKMGAGRGGPRESRSESTFTISRLWRRARRFRTGLRHRPEPSGGQRGRHA